MKKYKDITSRENSIYKLVRALSQKKYVKTVDYFS